MLLGEWNRGKIPACLMIPSCKIMLSLPCGMMDNGTEMAHIDVTRVNLTMEVTHAQPTIVSPQ